MPAVYVGSIGMWKVGYLVVYCHSSTRDSPADLAMIFVHSLSDIK